MVRNFQLNMRLSQENINGLLLEALTRERRGLMRFSLDRYARFCLQGDSRQAVAKFGQLGEVAKKQKDTPLLTYPFLLYLFRYNISAEICCLGSDGPATEADNASPPLCWNIYAAMR